MGGGARIPGPDRELQAQQVQLERERNLLQQRAAEQQQQELALLQQQLQEQRAISEQQTEALRETQEAAQQSRQQFASLLERQTAASAEQAGLAQYESLRARTFARDQQREASNLLTAQTQSRSRRNTIRNQLPTSLIFSPR